MMLPTSEDEIAQTDKRIDGSRKKLSEQQSMEADSVEKDERVERIGGFLQLLPAALFHARSHAHKRRDPQREREEKADEAAQEEGAEPEVVSEGGGEAEKARHHVREDEPTQGDGKRTAQPLQGAAQAAAAGNGADEHDGQEKSRPEFTVKDGGLETADGGDQGLRAPPLFQKLRKSGNGGGDHTDQGAETEPQATASIERL